MTTKANPRSPVETLTAHEGSRLRWLLRDIGPEAARVALGNISEGALLKAASEVPIARLTAQVIRSRLERL